MRIKILAALSALAAALGMVAFASVASSAHQGNIVASALCNATTGNYDVTYTLSWSNVPRGVHATLSSRTGVQDFAQGWTYDTWNDWISRGESTGDRGSLQWTEQLPGSTLGNGPWVYAYTEWSNGYSGSLGHDTRIENLGGDCKIPLPHDASATANSVPASCAAPGSVTFDLGNASWEDATDVTDGSRRAFADQGHLFSGGVSTIDVGYVIQPQKSGADCPAPRTPVKLKPTAPTVVGQQCAAGPNGGGFTLTPGGVSVVLNINLAYTVTGAGKTVYPSTVVTAALTPLSPGDYTVSVTPLNGTILDSRAAVKWPVTVSAARCAISIGDPYAVHESCLASDHDTTVPGHVWVDLGGNLRNELEYRITGKGLDYVASKEVNPLPAGKYTVTATAKTGYTLGNSPHEWRFTIRPAGCLLSTHGITPAKTPAKGTTNTAGSSGASSAVGAAGQVPALAVTGDQRSVAGLLLAGGLLLTGGTFLAVGRRLRTLAK